MSKVYRPGAQDKRERYSNRVQLLILPEIVVVEFDATGNVVGRDILDSISEAKLEFDALVELIEEQEGAGSVYSI